MHTEYFHRRTDLLVARLEPGEQVLARGRAFEPRDPLRFDLATMNSGPGCAVAVTKRRALWVSRDDQRWVRSLPFALVTSYTEITQAHRYALTQDHQSIERLQWVSAHQLLWWSWGNAEAVRPVTSSVLAFSRRDTKAARRSGVAAGGSDDRRGFSDAWSASGEHLSQGQSNGVMPILRSCSSGA
jgi:hypothetical protein